MRDTRKPPSGRPTESSATASLAGVIDLMNLGFAGVLPMSKKYRLGWL
jgi:hypothetical protein